MHCSKQTLNDVFHLDTPSINGWVQWKAINDCSLNSPTSNLDLHLRLVTTRSFLSIRQQAYADRLAPPTYSIVVQTADVPQTNTTDNVEMIVRGSDGQIGKFPLKERAKVNNATLFQRGHVDEFEVEHPNIGNVNRLLTHTLNLFTLSLDFSGRSPALPLVSVTANRS